MFVYSCQLPSTERTLWETRLDAAAPASVVWTAMGKDRLALEAYFIEESHAHIFQMAFGGSLRPLDASDGDDGWEPLPAVIGDRFLVVAPEAAQPPGSPHAVLQLRHCPEGVFAGHAHPTTLTCLRVLVALADRGLLSSRTRCLDMGCGAGWLGIAMAQLGAAWVDGVDPDATAIAAAEANARETQSTCTAWHVASLGEWEAVRPYDLVVANLFSALLETHIGDFNRLIGHEGILVLSGILTRFEERIRHAATAAGWTVNETSTRGPWVTLVLAQTGVC